MNCGCIDNVNDFYVDFYSTDCSSLSIMDYSKFESEFYEVPTDYEMEITLPNKVAHKVQVKVGELTRLTPKQLGVECIEDGLYCLKVNTCGGRFQHRSHTINKAITCSLQCRLDSYVARLPVGDKEGYDKVKCAQILIDGVSLQTEQGKPEKAVDFYEAAGKELDKLNCPKCGCC